MRILTVETVVVIINPKMPNCPTDTRLRRLVLNEARAYAVFANGHVVDRLFAVSLVCKELLQNFTFNRCYVLDVGLLTPDAMEELARDYISAHLSFQINVFLPISDEVKRFLRQKKFRLTEDYTSEMVLTKSSALLQRNGAVKVERLTHDLVGPFADALLLAYAPPFSVFQTLRYLFLRLITILWERHKTPSAAPPSTRSIFCRTIPSALEHKGVVLYLAYVGSKPVGVLYLFSEDGVGGLYALGVAPEARRRGVATALMLQAVEDSQVAGNSTLCLQTRSDSFQERFYGQLGFEVVARRNSAIQML